MLHFFCFFRSNANHRGTEARCGGRRAVRTPEMSGRAGRRIRGMMVMGVDSAR